MHGQQPTAADAWTAAIERWALPAHITAAADESPWGLDVARFAVDDTLDDTLDRSGTSARWAIQLLPPVGGTVLDVGCGGGRAALALVPPATELIGVDRIGAMLDEFVAAASRADVARRTFHGEWPDLAAITPPADVAICHHVLYDVADIVPFVAALTARARLGVVVEVPVRHPMSAWTEAYRHFWALERPDGPTHVDLVAVLRELGFDPEYTVGPRRPRSRFGADPSRLVPVARRRLCLSADRDEELGAWLDANPPAFVEEIATIRWPGEAGGPDD